METPGENNKEGTSETPSQKHSWEYLLSCQIMNQSIPDFWTTHPREWFLKFEAYMSLQNQEDEEYKFDIVVTKLKDNEAILAISDLFVERPKSGIYEALKKRLVDVFYVPKNELRSANNLVERNELLRRIEKMLRGGSSKDSVPEDRKKTKWICWHHWKFGGDPNVCDDTTHCNFDKIRLHRKL